MSDIRGMLSDTTRRALADGTGVSATGRLEQGGFPRELWSDLKEAGLLDVVAGGADGPDLGDIMTIVRLAGYYAAPVPLGETLLANWLLADCRLESSTGPLCIAPVHEMDRLYLEEHEGGLRLSGVAHAVAFARHCTDAVVMAEYAGAPWLVRIPVADAEQSESCNIAGEPRDTLSFTRVAVATDRCAPCPLGIDRVTLLKRGALIRCCAMAGAVARVLDLSAQYAKERVQFGRPIGKFQAVQQMMSQLAGGSAAATAAAEAATIGVEKGDGLFEVAAAKSRIGEAASLGAAIGHQVLGAMGFTKEHELHLVTRLIWVWREEFGSEAFWQELLGRTVAKAGGAQLWSIIVKPAGTAIEMPSGASY